ncbi:MAG: CPBP family glutamic-type intramembrane protease [Fulvivirga sp.]|nr:CPBP family glutamic-type intramembrane protease [Fulvivirga sp.]
MEKSLPHIEQYSVRKILVYHLYPGVIIVIFYILLAPYLVGMEVPSIAALLMAEIIILAPVEGGHMYVKGRKFKSSRFKKVILFNRSISWWRLILIGLAGIFLCFILYIPLYNAGIWLRNSAFYWLPDWFFNFGIDQFDKEVLIKTFAFGIFIDGVIGAGVEEFFFRGYLLPRMQRFGYWAPLISAFLFTIYHFWQPMNYFAILWVGLVISYTTWWTKSVWVAIFIHCGLNILGNSFTLMSILD